MANAIATAVDDRIDEPIAGVKNVVHGAFNWVGGNLLGENPNENQEKAGIWGTIKGVAGNTWRGVKDIFGANPETKGILFDREAYFNPFRIARAAAGGAIRTTTEFVGDSVGTVIGTQHGRNVEQILKGTGQIGTGWALGALCKELKRERGGKAAA
ncbi:hypothetical protein ACFL21_00610 [Patescibacteria group bacterium]